MKASLLFRAQNKIIRIRKSFNYFYYKDELGLFPARKWGIYLALRSEEQQ
jgi:hypothetical protein